MSDDTTISNDQGNILLAVSCLLAMVLIGCVEPNPGPLTPTKHTDEPREHHSDFILYAQGSIRTTERCLLCTVRR